MNTYNRLATHRFKCVFPSAPHTGRALLEHLLPVTKNDIEKGL